MCDESMMPCMPAPGNGMNITISIDLGSFMGNPCPPASPMQPQCPPSTSLTKMPCPPPSPMDPGKTVCFLDDKEQEGFKKAEKNTFSKFGGKNVDKPQKEPSKKDEEEECEEE